MDYFEQFNVDNQDGDNNEEIFQLGTLTMPPTYPLPPTVEEAKRCKELRQYYPSKVKLERRKIPMSEKLENKKKRLIRETKKCRKLHATNVNLFETNMTQQVFIPNLNKRNGEPDGWVVDAILLL